MNYTGGPSISGCRPVLPSYPTHYFCQYLLGIFITFTNSSLFCRAFSTNSRSPLSHAAGVTEESYPACQWLPLWGSWRAQARLRGLGRCQTALRRDSIALIKSLPIAAPAALSCRACPLRHCFAMPPLPKGEALAGRFTFHWTPEVRQDAKGRALLTGTAASGQRSLSSCRWPRQRSTATSETSCFARPDES